MVYGGQNHFRYDAPANSKHQVKKIKVNLSLAQLYEDWDSMKDEFGLITENQDNEVSNVSYTC